MKKNILVIITILLISSFFGCKKYEEGPCISFRSAENRLTGRYYNIEYLVNDIDSTSFFINNNYNANISFSMEDGGQGLWIEFEKINPPDVYSNFAIFGVWNLENSNKNIRLKFDERIGYVATDFDTIINGPISPDKNISWEITKLTDNDFHIKTFYNNKTYKLKLNH
ncbi:MAG: hypothetical protein ABIJ97_13915 [Bacteroidota bacterium]